MQEVLPQAAGSQHQVRRERAEDRRHPEDEDDDKGSIPGFATTYGAKFTIGWDGDKSIAHSYKPPTMPSSFLIDKNGIVRYAHVGYRDGEEAEVEKEIKELLAR